MADKKRFSGFRTVREGVITIALVLLCFLVLMSVLNLLFPTGTGLNLLIGRGQEGEDALPGEGSDLQLQRGAQAGRFSEDFSWAAVLEKSSHRVKSKRGNDIAWKPAQVGMRLYDQDAVQTLEKSTALIRFDAENVIDLDENSLIVIRRMEKDLLFKEKRSYMVMVDGVLRGRLNAADENGVYLEVALPNATTRLQAQPDGGEAVEFRIDVAQDEGSAVTIFSGEAEVEANGEAVWLGANQMTRIDGDAAPSAPVALPRAARLTAPDRDTLFAYRSLPPRVRLDWEAVPGIEGYRLLLARDRSFRDLVLEEHLQRPGFVHGNLTPGTYFWKVSSLAGQVEGAFSETRRFRLLQDQSPPELELTLPEQADHPQLEIAGRTEPDAQLFIAGQPVRLGTAGGFRHALALEPGINVIVVEAVDAAGNVTYRSQLIQGKF